MQEILDEISRCKGWNNCWGVASPCPIVLRAQGKMNVMVITEQRPQQKEHIKLEDELAEKKQNPKSHRSNVIDFIDKLFNHEFLNDFDEKEKKFKKFYWTHFIKCPGNIRKSDKKRNLQACANKWLSKEIKALDPRLIVAFGAYPGKWILKEASPISEDSQWIEWIWKNEIVNVARGTWITPMVKLGGKERALILMFHPSGQNTLGRKINENMAKFLGQSADLTSILS